MSNPWKGVALFAVAVTFVLCGILAWAVRRGNEESARLRHNVQEQIHYHLEQKEPGKAAAVLAGFPNDVDGRAAADAARVEIARASAPAEAAALLDPIDLSSLDGTTARSVADARLAVYVTLLKELVFVDGEAPTPYEPAYLRLKPAPSTKPEEMSRIVARVLTCIGQNRDLARRYQLPADPALATTESLARIARYALGEIAFDAVQPVDDERRILFGDLLFRERQFDRAIEIWKPFLKNPRVLRRLSQLARLRRLAPPTLKCWDYDVDRLMVGDAKAEAEGAAEAKDLFGGSSDILRPVDVFERKGIPKDDLVVEGVWEEPAIFFPGVLQPDPKPVVDPTVDPNQLYLLTEHHHFRLEVPLDKPFTTRSGALLRLHSIYRGPIRARLYKVASLETLEKLSEENLVERRGELSPVTEWEQEFAPLGQSDNKTEDWDLVVPPPTAGLYVVLAEARYCPVYAVAKFIVTDVGLVQQVASDQVLVFAADRASGTPVANLAVAGEVTGSFVLKPEMIVPADDSNAVEFKRGFLVGWSGEPQEPEATEAYQRGHEQAGVLHAKNPDVRLTFGGATGPDGLFRWKVEPAWKPGYQFKVRTVTSGGMQYSRVETPYVASPDRAEQRTLVYTDRPIYRPGDEVFFKGILRTFDGEGLQLYGSKEALFEFGTGSRVLFSRSFPVTDFGTASGSFTLPSDCAVGQYHVRVNNLSNQYWLFKVEEYRKPEFEIVLTHPTRVVAGRPVEVEILVRRYTGEPVPGADVSMLLSSATTPGRAMPERISRVTWVDLERRSLSTDAAGRCRYRFETENDVPRQFMVSASVLEPGSRRTVSRSSSLEATGPMKQVRIEIDRPSYVAGETAHLRIFADEAKALRIEERVQAEKPFAKSLRLENGAVAVDYVVPAQSRDLQVAVRDGDAWAWTAIPLTIVTPATANGPLLARLNRSIYRVGETALVHIESREPGQHVLVITATGRIHHTQVIKLEGKSKDFELPIVDDDVPNVTLSALAVRGDHLHSSRVEILVPPVDRFLTVQVDTDRKEYRPGDECRATVRVVDSKGRPVPQCELSLGVVDASLYALREDMTADLRDYFHSYQRQFSVRESFFFQASLKSFTIWKAPTFVRGLGNFGIGIGGGAGGRYGGRYGGRENLVARGGGATMGSANQVRSNFKETAAWQAHLVTGPDGTALVTFPFPDNLTTFRFTARGITRDHHVGSVTQTAVVRKELYVRLFLPRVVQEGDELTLVGLVQNTGPQARTLKLSFSSPYPLLKGDAPEELQVEPNGTGRVRYKVAIDRYVPSPEFRFGAFDGAERVDEIVLQAPGQRHGLPHADGRSGSLATGTAKEEVFRIPGGAIPGTVELKLTLDAGLHGAIVEALEPLIQYPYGCVEQTMSRFMPAVAADRALGGAPHRWSEKLPSVISAGLRRLYDLQSPEGWGWWHAGQGNASMTAYVLYGLAQCKKAGVGVDRDAVQSGVKSLRLNLENSVFRDQGSAPVPLGIPMDATCFQILALAEVESAWSLPQVSTKRVLITMLERSSERGTLDDILLALAARRVGMSEESEKVAKRVEARNLNDVPTAAFLLQLQAARGGETGPALRYLLTHRVGKAWRGTMESAMAILGLAAALDRSDATPGKVTVQVNGGPARELVLPDRADPSFDGRLTIPEPKEGWGPKAVALLKFEGKGTAFYTATLEAKLGGEDLAATQKGIAIEREYFVAEEEGWRPSDGRLVPGRAALVHLTLTTSMDRSYVMVTDPRGAGFEPSPDAPGGLTRRSRVVHGLTDVVDLGEGWPSRLDRFRVLVRGNSAQESAWSQELLREILDRRRFQPELKVDTGELPSPRHPDSIEHRDNRTVMFLSILPSGISHLYYVVRPELAGSVHVLPPQAQAMYEPDIQGTGRESRLTVSEEPRVEAGPESIPLPPGVEGLKALLPKFDRVDADVLISVLPSNPRIGELLLKVSDADTVRAWLSLEGATIRAGEGLRDRIEGARRDLATRRLCVDAMQAVPPGWMPVIESALSDRRLEQLVLQGTAPSDVGTLDNVLGWIRDDRDYRLGLLAAAQRILLTQRVQEGWFRPMSITRILEKLGSRAPSGDALIRWKLSQGGWAEGELLTDFIFRSERDLGLSIKLVGNNNVLMDPKPGSLSEILDRSIGPNKLYYVVRDGEVRVGPLDLLLK